MRNDRLSRELDIILMLAGTDDYTVGELCREAKVSRRTLYYYIECLRECGFDIYKSSGCYHIDRRSPFLSKLLGLLQFTEDEAVTLKRLVDMAGTANPTLNGVRRKLERFYDFSILSDVELRRKSAHIVSVLYEAIKQKRVAKLCGYSSPHCHGRVQDLPNIANGRCRDARIAVELRATAPRHLHRLLHVQL